MQKALFLVLAFTFYSFTSFAQKYSLTWGSIGEPEFDLKTYDKDPEAEAVILYDIGDSYFDITPEGLQIRFERTKRIKVLKSGGLSYADISIPYFKASNGKTEKVSGIKAITYNEENGQLVKSELSHSDIFDEIKSEHWREKKFAIPNVKVGSIFEFTYKLETPFMYNLQTWYFQDRIPTLLSRYAVRMVPFYEYYFIGQGLAQEDLKENKKSPMERSYAQNNFKDVIYTFEKTNIEAFRDESYITSINDYITKLDFQLAKINSPSGGIREISTTWPKLVDQLRRRESFGKYIKKSGKLAEQVLEEEVNLEGLTPEKKVKTLVEYTKKNFRWNKNMGHIARNSPKEFLNKRSGNIAEINLFLVALLRSAGIKATPVISSTREHGKIATDYPFEHFFNYTLVWVEFGSKSFITDGTATMINYNRIPTRCINHLGLAVDEGDGQWISLETKGYSVNRKVFATNIDLENKVANTSLIIQSTDFEAYKYKKEFQNDTEEMENTFEERGFESIESVKTVNYEKTHSPYIMQIEGKTELGVVGETLVINPLMGFPLSKNELTQEERNYPVDFIYARSNEFIATIGIPENYQASELPKPYKMINDLVEVTMEYTAEEKTIELNGKYFFKKAVYEPKEYKSLKSYIDSIIKVFNQELVLEKKK